MIRFPNEHWPARRCRRWLLAALPLTSAWLVCVVLAIAHNLLGKQVGRFDSLYSVLLTCFVTSLLWLPLFCNLLALSTVLRTTKQDAELGVCTKCGYSMRGIGSRRCCPECGAERSTIDV
jgi:hypothetical protein